MASLDLKDICDLLVEVESRLDVNDCVHDDTAIWPILRQILWMCYIGGNQGGQTDQRKKEARGTRTGLPYRVWRQMREVMKRWGSQKTSHPQDVTDQENESLLHNAEIVFLSQPIYYSEKLSGLLYNRIVDPLFEICSRKRRCIKIQNFAKDNIRSHSSFAYPSVYFYPLQLEEKERKHIRHTLINSRMLLGDICKFAGIEENFLTDKLRISLEAAIRYRDTYELILKKIQPRLVFLACYYFPKYMGLPWAAHRLGIPSVDIQHGKQGKYQGMYSHWTVIPENGYRLLPDWFWSWGERSKQNIMRWQSERTAHRCVVGGFPWISRWNEKEFCSNPFTRKGAGKNILITTQAPVGDFKDIFPDFIVESIRKSPANYRWIIRQHPNYKKGDIVIRNKLADIDPNNYMIDGVGEMQLYSLLSHCDVHVTAYSTVCYEAEIFGVPTAIISDIGRKLYSDEIKSGLFIPCSDAHALLEMIEHSGFLSGRSKYIESSEELAENAVHYLIQQNE